MNRDMFKRKMLSFHHTDHATSCYISGTSTPQYKVITNQEGCKVTASLHPLIHGRRQHGSRKER